MTTASLLAVRETSRLAIIANHEQTGNTENEQRENQNGSLDTSDVAL